MEQNYELEYFFTAFVDVLGQRERLRQLRGLPTTDEEMEKTVAVLRETAGFVLWLRKTFLRFFEACNASTGTFNALAPQQRQLAAELMHSEVQCRGVSDSIIITVSLTNTDEHCTPMNGVHDALVAVSAMFLSALSVRHPVRGGIDVGVGLTLGPEEVYGAALERAYFLESVRAE